MNFLKRFSYYLGGFGIGVVIVIFFLSGKETSCSYFPNARVLKEIRFKQQEISEEAQLFLKENRIDTLAIQKILHDGKVNFSQSQTSTKVPCRVYVINGTHLTHELQLEVEECKETDSIAKIKNIRFR